jgi:hypothetical protein
MKYLEYFFRGYGWKDPNADLSDAFKEQMAAQIKAALIKKTSIDFDLFEKKKGFLKSNSGLLGYPIESEGNAQYFEMTLVVDEQYYDMNVFFRHANGDKVDVTDKTITKDNIVFWYEWVDPRTEGIDLNVILHTVHHLRLNRKALTYDFFMTSFLPNDIEIAISAQKDPSQVQEIIEFLDDFFQRHNDQPGKRSGKVARFGVTQVSETAWNIRYALDLGTAPLTLLSRALEALFAFQTIERVSVRTIDYTVTGRGPRFSPSTR